MARKSSESEQMIQLLGYGTLTPTFTLIVHPWVHVLAGNHNTLYIPLEACALVGTIVSSEGIPLDFPPPNNLTPVQVDTIADPPQPQQSSNADEWSRLSNREILFLLQEDLVLNHSDITELGASKIEQLCEKYHKLTQSEIRFSNMKWPCVLKRSSNSKSSGFYEREFESTHDCCRKQWLTKLENTCSRTITEVKLGLSWFLEGVNPQGLIRYCW